MFGSSSDAAEASLLDNDHLRSEHQTPLSLPLAPSAPPASLPLSLESSALPVFVGPVTDSHESKQPSYSHFSSGPQTGMTQHEPLMAPDPLDPIPPPPTLTPTGFLARQWFHLVNYVTGSWSTFWYYLQHAKKEMQKRVFNYALGTLSCFLVVTVAATCYTLIARAPVVFLQQAEADNGQYDALLTIDDGAYNRARLINYTALADNLAISSDYSYHSPRLSFPIRMFDRTCRERTQAMGVDPMKSEWKYTGDSNTTAYNCSSVSRDCLRSICPVIGRADPQLTMYLIDTDRERRMELGRLWPYGTLPPNHAIISSALAWRKQLSVGDVFYVTIGNAYNSRDDNVRCAANRHCWLTFSIVNAGTQTVNGTDFFTRDTDHLLSYIVDRYAETVQLSLIVAGVSSDWSSKIGANLDDIIMIEYQSFQSLLIQSLHPVFDWQSIDELELLAEISGWLPPLNASYGLSQLPLSLRQYAYQSGQSMYEYASEVPLSLPPSRISVYMSSNYDDIQDRVVNWASSLMYFASFPQFSMTLPILDSLYNYRFFSLFLGLILSVILTILFVLSTMLIYSLLMISIETRTFELGVHRMVGMKTIQIIKMLLIQASSYAVPAWCLGLVVSQILAAWISGKIEAQIEVPVDRLLTQYSIGVASVLGLIIPLLAAILPIRTALSKNLHDSLDTQHSHTMGVTFNIERSGDGDGLNSAWLAIGSGFVVFGFLIYYLLPLSLLSFNLTLFFNLFFGILLGLLFGLILLSLNFQFLLERLLLKLFFWWEKAQIPFLVAKNLIAHRQRNRKTSIMFALSLGFIIFITVGYEVQIQSAKYRGLQTNGQYVTTYARNNNLFGIDAVRDYESFLSQSPLVADWAWVTNRLQSRTEFASTYMTNLGHAYSQNVFIYGVTSNFYEVTLPEFLIASDSDTSTSLSLSEQLFTVRGSQSAIIGTNAKNYFHFTSLDRDSSFLFALQSTNPSSLLLERIKPLALLDLSPRFGFTQFPTATTQTAIVSLTAFVEMSGGYYPSYNDIAYAYCAIKQRPGNTNAQTDSLVQSLNDLGSKWANAGVYDSRTLGASVAKVDAVMGLIFDSATYIAMGLCLFSLMASMFTNIYEQSKEIAIVRAMGLSSFAIIRIYLYEAFVLVLGASMLGMIIGAIMSWTMNAQQVLFTQLPVDVPFPYRLILLVIVGSFVCSIVAAFFPARRLMKKKIASIMRTVL